MEQSLNSVWIIVSLFIAFITIVGFQWKIMLDVGKLKDENDTKINRAYARFDEHKKEIKSELKELVKDIEKTYVRNKECAILHKTTAENQNRIEQKLDDLGRDMSNKIEVINQNILELMKRE